MDRIPSGLCNSIVRQKNHHLGHVIGRRMRMSSFPIQDARLVASDDFRHILLPQSKIESPLANCISYGRDFVRICLVLRFFPLQAHTTKEQRNIMVSLRRPA